MVQLQLFSVKDSTQLTLHHGEDVNANNEADYGQRASQNCKPCQQLGDNLQK